MQTTRRDFIKTACAGCASLLIPSVLSVTLEGCKTASLYHASVVNKQIELPLTLFTSSNLQIVRAKNLDYDLAVRKTSENNYTAIQMTCTHAENPLQSTGNGFVCSLHGSTFSSDGTVTTGPAARNLKQFPVIINNDNLIIKIQA